VWSAREVGVGVGTERSIAYRGEISAASAEGGVTRARSRRLGVGDTSDASFVPFNEEEPMKGQPSTERDLVGEEIPTGQRIFESPFLLLVAGILVMVVFYTGWGLWEILSLQPAPLP
jgi:hypothetical protein